MNMKIKIHDTNPRFTRRKALFSRGVLLLSALFAPLLTPERALAATSTLTGDIVSQHLDTDYVQVQTGTGASSVTLSDYNTVSVELRPAVGVSGSFSQTLTITGSTTITNPTYSGIIMQTGTENHRDASVTVGSGVTVNSGSGFGGIWVRNDGSGDVYINSAATVTALGPTGIGANDGVTGVTNLGSVTLINSGTVTTTSRGLYADGGGTTDAPVVVSITNSGFVTATLAGARSINYVGLSSIDNSGTVISQTKQALVAWSADGPVTIVNSGTASALNNSAIVAAGETGNVTVTNSGHVSATGTDNGGAGFAGILAYSQTQGDVAVTNEATGTISAGQDMGIGAFSVEGNIVVFNHGQIDALYGIIAGSGDGSVTATTIDGAITNATGPTTLGTVGVLNTGSVTAQGLGILLDGTANILVNTGTISTTGTLGIQTGNGNTLIGNAGTILASGSNAVAIAMGSGSNRLLLLTETSAITGLVTNASTGNTLELTGTTSTSFDIASVGDAAQYRGFGTVEKSGGGVITLTGTGFGGSVTVHEGTLRIGSPAQTYGGALTNNALLDLGTNVLTVGGNLSGTGAITLTIGSGAHGYLVNANAASNLTQTTFAINPGSAVAPNQTLILVKDYTGQAPVGTTIVSGYRLYRIVEAGQSGIDSQGGAYGAGSLLLSSVPLSKTSGYTPVPTNNASLVIQNYGGANPALGNLSLAVQSLTKASEINKAGAQLRPDANGGTQRAALNTASQALEMITLRNDTIRAAGGLPPVGDGPNSYPRGLDLWGQTFYTNATQGQREGVDGFRANTAGIAIGADTQVADAVRLGVSLAFASTVVDDSGTRAGSGEDVDSFLGSIYASYSGDPWYLDAALVGGVHQYETTRLVDIGGIRELANGRFSGKQTGVKLEGGYPVDLGKLTLTPLASLAYNHLSFGDYTENGAPGANLRVRGDSLDSLRSGLGVKISTAVATSSGWVIQPGARAYWFHEFGDTSLDQTSQFVAAGGSAFTTPGIGLARNGLGLGASVNLVGPRGVNLGLKYDAELQKEYVSHAIVFEARLKF